MLPTTATTGLVFPANYGIKPEAALVMDWSPEEQYVLENGLAKYVSFFFFLCRFTFVFYFWIFPSHLQFFFINYLAFSYYDIKILGIVL